LKTALKAILQQEFQKCFQQWQHGWAKRVAARSTPMVIPLNNLLSIQDRQ